MSRTAPSTPAPSSPAPSTPDADASPSRPDAGRRQMLRRLGMGAGAVAGVGMLAVANAAPAAADDDDHVVLGASGATANTASHTTEIRSSDGTGTLGLFLVQDGTVNFSIFPAAIQGFASGAAVSTGVYGYSSANGGAGVVGSGDVGLVGAGSVTDLRLIASGTAPPATSVEHLAGDVIADVNDDIWACVAEGTPGTFRKVSGPGTAGQLHLLPTPTRVYDTRPGNAPLIGNKAPLGNGSVRDTDAKNNGSGVPDGATAVLANFTVVNTSASGFLAAYRSGIEYPGTSTLNWSQAGTIVANTTVVALSSAETFRCFVPPGSSTDFFVDVIGYYR